MNKTLTVRQFATIRRVAQNVNPLVIKKNKLLKQIEDLQEECENLKAEIEGHEMGIKALTGGFTSEDLVLKLRVDKTTKEGTTMKTTRFEYNPQVLKYNEETSTYEIISPSIEGTLPDTEELPKEEASEPATEPEAFSDIENLDNPLV